MTSTRNIPTTDPNFTCTLVLRQANIMASFTSRLSSMQEAFEGLILRSSLQGDQASRVDLQDSLVRV